DTRVQNFEIQFLKEAAKFVGDFKSLAKEANEYLVKHKALELEIERLLRAVVSQDIMSVMQNTSVDETSNLQTELERTKERFENCIIKKENEYAELWNDWTNLITVSQPPVITKKVVNSDSNGLSSTGVDNIKTRRPHPKSNTKNDRVPSMSKNSQSKNKEVEVEEHHRKLLLSRSNPNMFMKFLGTVRFGNDHVAVILAFGDLQWGNILITRVYFVEGLGYNLFSVGQFCDSDLEVAFRRNACFIRNLEGVDLLKGNRSTNLYTINLHEMASASLICLIARAFSTKLWLWHQRLSHLNFDTINDLAKNDLVSGHPKFKYHKEHLTHPNLFQILGKAIATACFTQNRFIIHCRFNKTPYELINGRKPDISFLYVFEALCYPKNDREDIGKLSAKGDIGFFIGYSTDSCAYRVYNRRTKKIMETMNVSFDELLTMAFEQRELDLLFNAMYDDYIGGQPSTTPQTVSAAQAHQDVDELNLQQQHAQQQGNQAPIQPKIVADNVPNAMFDVNTFVNPFANPSTSAAESSSSQYVDLSNMHTFYQPYPHEFQWTKDHPLEQNHFFKGTTDPTLFIRSFVDDILVDSGFKLTGFPDVDYAGCKDTFKSTFGRAQLLGEKLVSWSLKKQDCMVLSTTEAEYVSLSACCAQVLWMRTQLTDDGFHFKKIPIYYDSKSAIAISCNPLQHSRTKHIAVRYHFIKKHVEKSTI
nr:retrovirus-related Pol polyprotein from transposon TNT 1-94 [Tanacetum cinerariifolium]